MFGIEKSALGGERMFDLVALGDDLGGLRFTTDRARDRLLGGAIVVILDFLVVLGLPVNEYADADEQVVCFLLRNDPFRHAVGYRFGNGVLRWAEHLHGLFRALDRHLIEQDG